jgi:Nuclease A inhibitor-like protein
VAFGVAGSGGVGDEPHKDVYIVGQTHDGKLARLKTSVVET